MNDINDTHVITSTSVLTSWLNPVPPVSFTFSDGEQNFLTIYKNDAGKIDVKMSANVLYTEAATLFIDALKKAYNFP